MIQELLKLAIMPVSLAGAVEAAQNWVCKFELSVKTWLQFQFCKVFTPSFSSLGVNSFLVSSSRANEIEI